VERARPDAPLRDLRELLQALDQVAFATAHGVDVAPLAARARALARELGGNGAKREPGGAGQR
jgi:predicted trehalose synthase